MYQRPIRPDELYHFGILGMHWGIRRFQNEDGTWKNAKAKDRHSKQQAKSEGTTPNKRRSSSSKAIPQSKTEAKNDNSDIVKKVATGVAIAAVAALGVYGSVKLAHAIKMKNKGGRAILARMRRGEIKPASGSADDMDLFERPVSSIKNNIPKTSQPFNKPAKKTRVLNNLLKRKNIRAANNNDYDFTELDGLTKNLLINNKTRLRR